MSQHNITFKDLLHEAKLNSLHHPGRFQLLHHLGLPHFSDDHDFLHHITSTVITHKISSDYIRGFNAINPALHHSKQYDPDKYSIQDSMLTSIQRWSTTHLQLEVFCGRHLFPIDYDRHSTPQLNIIFRDRHELHRHFVNPPFSLWDLMMLYLLYRSLTERCIILAIGPDRPTSPFGLLCDQNTHLITWIAYPPDHKIAFLKGIQLESIGAHQSELGYRIYFLGFCGPPLTLTNATQTGSFLPTYTSSPNWSRIHWTDLTPHDTAKFSLTWSTAIRQHSAIKFKLFLGDLPLTSFWIFPPIFLTLGIPLNLILHTDNTLTVLLKLLQNPERHVPSNL